jgi:hemerythrin superfamily protein
MTSTNESQTTVAVIAEQHVELRRLMDSVAAGTAEESSQSFDRLVRLMAVHETAEEMVVYPAIRKMGEQGRRIADARSVEEDVAKRVLAKLEGMDRTSSEFQLAFLEFRADVEGHAASEEAEVFPLLAKVRDDEPTMRKVFMLVEQLAPTHAHRLAPESALGNLLVGPFVSIVDRTRDAIRDVLAD